MEMSLEDILSFIEKLLRAETTLSGGGCNDLMIEVDIGCPYPKVWLNIKGDDTCTR